jgi:hypothetical protein
MQKGAPVRQNTNIVRMTVADAVDQLPDNLPDEVEWTVVGVLLDDIQHGQLAVVKDQVKDSLSSEHLNQLDEIWVLQLAQHAHFAHGDLSNYRIGVVLRVALDGDDLACLPVDALEYDALFCGSDRSGAIALRR